jgi:hypothetical protein
MINNLLEDFDSEERGEELENRDAYHLIKSRLDFIIIQKNDNEVLL